MKRLTFATLPLACIVAVTGCAVDAAQDSSDERIETESAPLVGTSVTPDQGLPLAPDPVLTAPAGIPGGEAAKTTTVTCKYTGRVIDCCSGSSYWNTGCSTGEWLTHKYCSDACGDVKGDVPVAGGSQ